jgi:hypothetical protein
MFNFNLNCHYSQSGRQWEGVREILRQWEGVRDSEKGVETVRRSEAQWER